MQSTVAVVKCGTYDELQVHESISRALGLLGGIGRYVKKGDRVLLKPNLLSASSPDRAITTHPALLKAMVLQVQSAGGMPIIADSPGGPFTKGTLEKAYEKSGWNAVSVQTGAVLNLDTGSRSHSNPQGKLAKRLDIISVLDDVDVVITLPKMKTHTLTHMTGATKILFGLVPGLTKPAYHLKFPEPERFCDMLLDILTYVKPSLAIMDGVVAMEGDGPGAQGSPKRVGAILASPDSVALDVVAASIMGAEPKDMMILRRAIERGLTSGILSDINVVGDGVDSVRTRFRMPSQGRGLVGRLLAARMFNRLLLGVCVRYPKANDRCIRCGICKLNCPAKAITISDRAHMDLGHCIRCYCCHELCPQKAIELKAMFGWLGGKKGKS